MNLREFCQLKGYSDALLTTFSFDPLFFERVVFSDLHSGGAKRITVMVDAAQALPAIEAVHDQLFFLGRRYRVIPVTGMGAFHPKMCVRLSKERSLIACGSGNLTRSGWLGRRSKKAHTGNREIVSAFQVLPNSPQAGDLLRIRDQLSRLPDLVSEQNTVIQTLSQPWLDDFEPTAPETASWLMTGTDRSLASVLESRWSGRRFDRLHIVTGSTDTEGQMIRWAQRTFGIQQAIVHTDLDTCSFVSSKLGDIGLDLQIVGYDGSPRTHLKLAVFESATGPSAAVAGSANCSGAAWLRTSHENGNIESVIVFDTCDPADFEKLYRQDHSPEPWSSVSLKGPVNTESETEPEPPRILKRMELDNQTGQLKASLEFSHETAVEVRAVVGISSVPLKPLQDHETWIGPKPDIQPGHLKSLFGYVEIIGPEGTLRSNLVWIDDLDTLTQATESHASSVSLYQLKQSGTTKEYQELLKNIHLLSNALLDQPGEVADGIRTQSQAKDSGVPADGPRIDPRSLLRSLTDQHHETTTLHTGDVTLGANPLTGILRMIFAESQSDLEAHHADITEAESQRSAEEEESTGVAGHKTDEAGEGSKSPAEIPTEVQAKKLLDQLNQFVDKLADPNFADICTAQAVKQAAAFPLGVAQFVRGGPWEAVLDKGAIDRVIERLCEVLLLRRVKFTDKKKGGTQTLDPLITRVQERYKSEGRVDTFDQIIGDGTLWLVLSSAITKQQGDGFSNFRRNLILRDIVRAPILLSSVVHDHIKPLAKKLANNIQQPDFIGQLEIMNRAFTKLEVYLHDRFEDLKSDRNPQPQVNDWLWNPHVGFAVIEKVQNRDWAWLHFREKENTNKRVQLSCYANLMWLMEQDPEVADLMRDLFI